MREPKDETPWREGRMRVVVVGDVHGAIHELPGYLMHVKKYFRVEAAIQVGDFGFFKDLVDVATESGVYFPVPLHAIDGNHEDHAWLKECMASGVAGEWKSRFNLHFMPRGSVEKLGSSTVGFLGGALHVDRKQFFSSRSLASNYIQKAEIENALQVFGAGAPELIVTHSCPAGIGIGMKSHPLFEHGVYEFVKKPGFDPGPQDDCGDMELALLWKSLERKPQAWAFGHFHHFHEATVDGTHFVCAGELAADGRCPCVIWETEEKRLITVRMPQS